VVRPKALLVLITFVENSQPLFGQARFISLPALFFQS
jgi:hypothetical protein